MRSMEEILSTVRIKIERGTVYGVLCIGYLEFVSGCH